MKITADNKYDLIEDYLSGKMKPQEASLFESLLNGDDELAIDVNLVRELHDFQEFSAQEESLKATLQQVHNDVSDKKPSLGILKYIAIFAMMALGLFLLIKTLVHNDNITDYSPIAMIEPLELVTKADNDFKDLQEMQDLYNSGDYKSAYPYILSYLQNNPADIDIHIAKGIALMEMDKYSDAHNVFEAIASLGPRVKKYKWYMAINYLKEGNRQKATEILESIKNTQSYNYKEASSLLESLK